MVESSTNVVFRYFLLSYSGTGPGISDIITPKYVFPRLLLAVDVIKKGALSYSTTSCTHSAIVEFVLREHVVRGHRGTKIQP